MIRISEIYGGGISGVTEGEGALLGERLPFVRVAGCNLTCSWCDSSYTWRSGYVYEPLTAAEVLARLDALGGGWAWVSITGGEPTLYRDLGLVVDGLAQRGCRAIVETNGLHHPAWLARPNVLVSCSPKLPGSGQDSVLHRHKVAAFVAARRSVPDASHATQYKFVVATADDLAALVPYCQEVGISLDPRASDYVPVYAQPDGYIQPLPAYLAALAWLQRDAPDGVRVTPQVHRLIHGPDARGV